MTKTELEHAIRVNTAKEAIKAVHQFIAIAQHGVKLSKQEKKPIVLLPNWKFKEERVAVEFLGTVIAALGQEEFLACRIETEHEGHLRLLVGWGMTVDEFKQAMEDLQGESEQCDKCGKEAKIRACGGCGAKSYCGEECQRADWKAHKEACKEKSKLYKSVGIKGFRW